MNIFAKTDKGLVRETNQDIVVFNKLSDNFSWILVCDGMGGQNSGDIASKMAADIVKKLINENVGCILEENFNIKDFMNECLEVANKEIFEKSLEDEKYRGMGTTAVLMFIIKDNIYISYVGDSRAYIISDKKLEQITTDHSIVQEMVNNGEITEEEARKHPRKNIITKAIGVMKDIEIDNLKRNLLKDESVLLCTDGFSNFIDKETILDYFSQFKGETLVNKLITHVNEVGGNDNITVAVVTS